MSAARKSSSVVSGIMSAARRLISARRMDRRDAPARRAFIRGFTLIEMMVAVAILGIIMVMLASSFHAVAAGKTTPRAAC